MLYRKHRHMCVDNQKEYVHDHSDGSTHEDSKQFHEHDAHGLDLWLRFEEPVYGPRGTDEGWDGGVEGPMGVPGSDEDELQEQLGFPAGGSVTYTLKKRKRVTDHVAYLEMLQGVPGYSSCITCACGWVMAFADGVGVVDATDVFMGHAQPGVEWIG